MKKTADLLAVLGFLLVVAACFLIWRPLGPLAAGAGCLQLARAANRAELLKRKRAERAAE
jgi:hypothetical protein